MAGNNPTPIPALSAPAMFGIELHVVATCSPRTKLMNQIEKCMVATSPL